MQVFVEIWNRRKRDRAYRHQGIEQIGALLDAGMPMMVRNTNCILVGDAPWQRSGEILNRD
jgi:hypothetical protein